MLAIAGIALAVPAAASAAPAPSGALKAPKRAALAGTATARVVVVNRGRRSRATVLAVLESLDGRAKGATRVGRAHLRALGAGKRTTIRLRLRIATKVGAGPVRLLACVGRRCSAPVALQVFSDSALDRIDRAHLSTTQKLIYKLEAIAGDRRLPKRFRGPTPVQDENTVFTQALLALPGLSGAARRLVSSFLIPPRYRGSYWTPRATGRSSAPAAAADYGSDGCNFLQGAGTGAGGAWSGVQSTHAIVWHASGNAAAAAKARQVSGWIERDIWPKETAAFREPLKDQASGCDPAGDNRLDVFLLPDVGRNAEGLALPLKSGADCDGHPSVVMVNLGASKVAVAHEFMHAIQHAYPGFDCRAVLWLSEGMAEWAQTFVYPSVKEHHRYPAAVTAPTAGVGNPAFPYDSWAFWYWLAKHDGVPALKEVLQGMAGARFQQVLDRVPAGGLDEAFRNYAAWVYNTAPPIGRPGFPSKSFAQWDGLVAKQLMPDPLKLTEPVKISLGFGSLPPLAIDFRAVAFPDKKIRGIEITNPLASTARAGVLAFIKLNSGEWVYRDISSQSKLSLCRDHPQEDVQQIVLAVDNSSPEGGDRAAAAFPVEGKTACTLPAYNGTFSGTWTSDFNKYRVTWTGSAKLEVSQPNGAPPEGWPPGTYAHYRVISGSVHASLNGTRSGASQDSCTVHGEADFQLVTTFGASEIDVQTGTGPGEKPSYYVSFPTRGDEQIPYTETGDGCNQQNPQYPLTGVQWAYTSRPLQADPGGNLTANTTWDPSAPGPGSHFAFQFSFAPG